AVRARLAADGILASGEYAYRIGMTKERALHQYRDQVRQARRDIERIYGREGWLHALVRRRVTTQQGKLDAPERARPLIDAWREPPRSGGDRRLNAPQPWTDPTERTLEKSLSEIGAAGVEDFK